MILLQLKIISFTYNLEISAFMGNKNKQSLVFWVLFIVLSIHFKFYETINLAPQSTDLWRQADCYSIALNYYQNGFHFFKPQVHFLFEQNGYAAGEFPIIYFVSAILFKIFGVHYFLFKGLNLLIFFTGLYSLFRLSLRLTDDILFSYILSILYFCTPIVFFYANNFLSDVSALSFNIIGTLFFIKFLDDKSRKKLLIAATCFALAGLLKASASIFLIAIICSIFTELFITKTKSKFFIVIKSNQYQIICSLTIALSIIVSWYLYAIAFNQSNHTAFFGTKAMKGWPIWENNFMEINESISYFKIFHIEILSPVNLILFLFSSVLIVIYTNRVDRLLLKIWIFLQIGLSLFIAYFWKGFQDQQYYLVNLLMLPILSLLFAYKLLLSFNLRNSIVKTGYTILIFSTLYVIYTSKNVYKCYYKGGWRHQKLNTTYYEKDIEKELNKMGITKKDKVISLEDGTPNGSLSMLNRSGWSSYGFKKNNLISYEDFESKINMGATYLILNDTSILKNDTVKYYAIAPLGNYKALYFYKLRTQN
jgi:hypothetical protein